jgi:hypothetical protein
MTSSTPGYDNLFPSAWAFQGDEAEDEVEDEEVLLPSQSITPTRDDTAAIFLPPGPIPPFNDSAPPNQYLCHFPSSWVLPPDDTHTFLREASPASTIRPRTQTGNDAYMHSRSQTAFYLGSPIASTKENTRAKSFYSPTQRGDRVETFRHELLRRLTEGTRVKDAEIYGSQVAVQTNPLERNNVSTPSPPKPKDDSIVLGREVGSGAVGNDNDTVWGECVSIYSAQWADAPHLPPPVAAAYSSRTTSSVISG